MSQFAQRLGFLIGGQYGQAEKYEELRRLSGNGSLTNIKVSNSILLRSDYITWK